MLRAADHTRSPTGHPRQLKRAHACVIIKFDLSAAQAADNAPAMAPCKFTDFLLRHISEDPQLRRLRHDVFGADGESVPDFCGESWQIVVHL
jgi:hypothetical protein